MSQETDHPAGVRASLEAGIAEWRSYVRRRQAIHAVDVDELEDHLRSQASALVEAGLTEDEAFLIAVKRIGDLDALSREFAREHAERLWKRLVVAPDAASGSGDTREAVVAVALAVGDPPQRGVVQQQIREVGQRGRGGGGLPAKLHAGHM